MMQLTASPRSALRQNDVRPMRALFVIPSLRMGGAERVFATLLNEFSATFMDLHLAVLQREGMYFDTLSPRVTVHDLNVRRAVHSFPRLQRLTTRLQPDVVLATSLRLNLVVTLLKPLLPSKTRIVIREVTAMDALLGRGVRAAGIRSLARMGYRQADAVVCQSATLASELQRSGISNGNACVIHNPVDFAAVAARSRQGNPYETFGPGPHVVAVGRLEPAKGIDRLVSAFPHLLERRPDAHLWLVGDGREAAKLEHLAELLSIRRRVKFVGVHANPYPWMRHADLLALPSRREGMPNTLLEAIACDCPVVVLDHPGGSRDAMRLTGQEWRVVDDLSVWDDAWFERPPASVLQRAREHFSLETVVEQYRQVLMETSRMEAICQL